MIKKISLFLFSFLLLISFASFAEETKAVQKLENAETLKVENTQSLSGNILSLANKLKVEQEEKEPICDSYLSQNDNGSTLLQYISSYRGCDVIKAHCLNQTTSLKARCFICDFYQKKCGDDGDVAAFFAS